MAVPSSISLVITLAAVRFLGIEAFGIWLIGRSIVQLTVNVTPGWSASLPVTMPAAGRRTSLALERRAERLTFGFGSLLGAALLAVALALVQDSRLVYAFALYWTGLFFSAHTSLTARGRCDGWRMSRGALIDTVGAIAVLGVLSSGSLLLFIAAQGLRAWAKGLALRSRVRLDGSLLPNRRFSTRRRRVDRQLLRIGFPMVIRGWLQTATQYGDRLLLGLFFGPVVAGAGGLGSTLALPLAVVASATATWIIPLSSRTTEGGRALPSVARECLLLGAFGVGLAMIVPSLSFFVAEVETHLQLVLSGFALLFGVAMSVLAGSFLISIGRLWVSNGLALFVVLSMAATMASVHALDLSPAVALLLASTLSCLGSVIVLARFLGVSSWAVGAAVFVPLSGLVALPLLASFLMSSAVQLSVAAVGLTIVAVGAWTFLSRRSTMTAVSEPR
ncbi:MAG: hypothetical protein EA350_14260 [Gemmatimonadales bacterium]|nr:MAG: hypothetical protein EA350_14260 [Gemmatimonadales bacterium]